jgi:hypothetical protein
MAQLNFTEHDEPPVFNNNMIPALSVPPVAEQQVTVGAGSLQSSAFTARYIRMHTDTACRVKFGANPTAAATTAFVMAANTAVVVRVTVGQKLAVIAV